MQPQDILIALDIDGTIADEQGRVSNYTAQQIAFLQKKGYTICLVTGRQWISTIDVYQQCHLNTLCVLCNGALVYHPITNEKIREIVIPLEDINRYIEDDEFMSHIADMMCELDFNTFSLTGKFFWRKQQIVGSFKKNLYRAPNSLNVYAKSYEDQKEIQRLIRKNPKYDYRYWIRQGEIFHISFSKKEGVEQLLSYYHKDMSQLLFIGDGENDIELLKCAGCSVAMKNASDEVKKVSQLITDYDVKEDGAIRFILHYLQNKNGSD